MKIFNTLKGIKLLTFVFLFSIITTILAIVFSYKLMNSIDLVNEATKKRNESLVLAYELKQSSTDLTRFARLYVETKHPRYKYYYEAIKGIRSGYLEKPDDYKDYGNFYWDIKMQDLWYLENDEPNFYFEECECLDFIERMKELNFEKEEFDLLLKSQKLSDSLSILEEAAFSIIEQDYYYYGTSDESDIFIDPSIYNEYIEVLYADPYNQEILLRTEKLGDAANQAYAKYLLFNSEYLSIKSQIMQPITKFRNLVDERTKDNLEEYQHNADDYLTYSVLLSIASLGFLCTLGFVIFITRQKNEKLLFSLNKKNTYLEHAAKILRHDMHSGINVYIPRGVSSLKRRLTDDDIKKLKIGSPIQMISEGLKHTRKVYKGVYEFTNLVKKDAVIHKEEHNIKDILQEFLSHTSYKSQVVLNDNLPVVNVNDSLFCTAIDNLIRNGLKYNDSDTKVVKVYYEHNSICVEDNGRGMSQKEFEYLSRPYTRREGQKESGMGLGLNICNSILEEHGFSISVERLETGTKIKIKVC